MFFIVINSFVLRIAGFSLPQSQANRRNKGVAGDYTFQTKKQTNPQTHTVFRNMRGGGGGCITRTKLLQSCFVVFVFLWFCFLFLFFFCFVLFFWWGGATKCGTRPAIDISSARHIQSHFYFQPGTYQAILLLSQGHTCSLTVVFSHTSPSISFCLSSAFISV